MPITEDDYKALERRLLADVGWTENAKKAKEFTENQKPDILNCIIDIK